MADRFWVGGAGTWDTTSTTNWSATSGGGSGASVPTAADSVFFDQAGTYTVTLTGALSCLNFTVSAGTVTFAQGTSPSLAVSGSMTLLAGGTWSSTLTITFNATTTGNTITTNGVGIAGGINFNGVGGGWTLGSALTLTSANSNSSITWRAGTFNTNNFNITTFLVTITNSTAKTINFGSSTISIGGNGSNAFAVSVAPLNLTFNAGTSQINLTDASGGISTAVGTGLNFYNVAFTSTAVGTRYIIGDGNNTFNNLSVTGPSVAGLVTLSFGASQTINGTLSTTGTAGNRRVFFTTFTYGISRDLVVNSAPSLTDADFRGLYVRGTAASISGTRIGNRGECRGITFSTPKTVYWVTSGSNWADNNWSDTSTGSPSTDFYPLPQDVATFTNSFGSGTINMNVDAIGSFDASAKTTTVNFNVQISPTVYGNWTNGSGVTIITLNSITFSGGGTQTITSAGRPFNQLLTIDTYGGTVQLADALNVGTNALTVTNGAFNTLGYAVTAGSLAASGTNVKTITLGASTLTLSGSVAINFNNALSTSFFPGTSQINLNSSGAASITTSGFSFYNVAFIGTLLASIHSISGANTFNNLTFTAPAADGQIQCNFSDPQTINGTLTCAGASAVRRIFLRSNTIGTPRRLTVNSISATDCDFRDITLAGAASGASITRAGDCGGNTGITFPAPKTVYWNLAGAQNWSATGWAPSSGGTPDINQFPLAQDTAAFDNTGAAGTVTINFEWAIGNINMASRTSAMTLSLGSGGGGTGAMPPVYGNVTFGTGVATSTSFVTVAKLSFIKNGTQTLVTNGITLLFNPSVDRATTTLLLGDALTMGASTTLIVTAGTFDAATYNVTLNAFRSNTSSSNLIRMGSGTWSLTGTGTVWDCSTAPLINKGTATINLTNNTTTARSMVFSATGGRYPKITIGGNTSTSTTTLNGAFDADELASTKTVAHTISLNNTATFFGYTTTIRTWSVTGTVGNVVTVAGNQFSGAVSLNILQPTSGIDYLALTGSLAFTTNQPFCPQTFWAGANSTGSGGVSGATLTATPASRTLYWVGGTGNWSDTTKWSLSSGGPGGQPIPGVLDNVIFDSASSATAYTVTQDNYSNGRAKDATFSGPATGNLTVNANTNPFYFWGSATIAATGVVATNARFSFTSAGSYTFTTNGVLVELVTLFGTGTCTLGSALNYGSFSDLSGSGKLVTANYSVTGGAIFASELELDLGSSTLTFTRTFTQNRISGRVTAGTSNIFFVSTSTYAFGSVTDGFPTLNNVTFTLSSGASITLPAGTTYNNLTLAGPPSDQINTFNLAGPITVTGTLAINGSNYVRRVALASSTIGVPVTVTANTLSATDADFRDITLAGAAAGTVLTRAGNWGGNSGITFPAAKTVYWNLAGSQNWGSNGWAASSGAAPAVSNFPLAQDTAVFDNAGAAGTVATNLAWGIGTLNLSSRTTAMTLTISTAANIYGSLLNGTGVTWGSSAGLVFRGRGSNTITSNGAAITQPITINTVTGTVTLADALSGSTNALTLTTGTFNASSFNVTRSSFINSNTANTLQMGSGTWTLTGVGTIWSCSTAPTIVAGTANIVFSDTTTSNRTFAGGDRQYNKLTIGGATGTSTTTISGTNTFTEIASTKTVAHTIAFSNNQSVGAWTVTGTAGNIVTLTGSPSTLVLTNIGVVSVDYLNVSLVRALPVIDKWYAGLNSINGGSLGFIFSSGPAIYAVFISETSTGSDQINTIGTLYSLVNESGTASDLIAAFNTYNVSIADSSTASDQVAALVAFASSVAESGSASDLVSALAAFGSQTSETSTATDQPSAAAAFGSAVTETGAASDQVAAAAAFASAVVDTSTAADQVSALASLRGNIAETAAGSDLVSALGAFGTSVSESGVASDANIARANFGGQVIEASTAADITSASATVGVQIQEAGTVLDEASNNLFGSAFILESATITDATLGSFLWNLINDSQDAGWLTVPTPQPPGWSDIDDSQNPAWQNT